MGPKHRPASPLIIIIKLNQRGTDTMQWLGLGNVFPTATVLSDVGLLSHIQILFYILGHLCAALTSCATD